MADRRGWRYVGHAADLDAVPARYTNNVIRCLNGLEYHNKPSEFRPVHKALARAVRDEKRVTLTFLENVASASDRQSRKLELIKELRAVFEPQGLQILNGRQKRAT